VIPEPLGGAHRDPEATARAIKSALLAQLDIVQAMDMDQLIAERYSRLMGFGRVKEQRPAGGPFAKAE